MSIGRYMSEMKKQNEEDEKSSFDIAKFSRSEFNKTNNKKTTTPIFKREEIYCEKIVTKEEELTITIKFNNVEFLNNSFEYLEATKSYFMHVNNSSYLTLITIGDILECEIIFYNGYNNFIDEIYIPELLKTYDPLTKNVTLKEDIIIVTYQKYGK